MFYQSALLSILSSKTSYWIRYQSNCRRFCCSSYIFPQFFYWFLCSWQCFRFVSIYTISVFNFFLLILFLFLFIIDIRIEIQSESFAYFSGTEVHRPFKLSITLQQFFVPSSSSSCTTNSQCYSQKSIEFRKNEEKNCCIHHANIARMALDKEFATASLFDVRSVRF